MAKPPREGVGTPPSSLSLCLEAGLAGTANSFASASSDEAVDCSLDAVALSKTHLFLSAGVNACFALCPLANVAHYV